MRSLSIRQSIPAMAPVAAILLMAALPAAAQEPPPSGADAAETTLDEIVVSAPLPRTLNEFAQPASVVDESEIRRTAGQGSLGDVLASQPGVSSSSFGPGAGRPVIRGLGGDRVRVLQDGVGSQDVSNTSPDHAVASEPLLSDRIEIIHGPATLMYGTSAIGGVVNVLDRRIPEARLDKPAEGAAEVRGGTVNNERTGVASITGGIGNVVIHAEGVRRKTGDIGIPGFARTGSLRSKGEVLPYPEPRKTLPFSATDTETGSAGASVVGGWGYFGVAGSYTENIYGVPNGEEDISITMKQPRLDIRSRIDEPLPFFRSLTFKTSLSDYKHTEFEGSETGTKFFNDALESRIELAHERIGSVEGVFGFQVQHSDFSALGEEAFQPPTSSRDLSGFVFEEIGAGEPLRLQLGLRADFQRVEADFQRSEAFEGRSDLERSFRTVSGSSAILWNPATEYTTALSVSYTQRPPSGQELFADGPHVATTAFEIGDSELTPERSIGIDLNVRKDTGRVTGFAGVYANRFDRFVALSPTGNDRDGLPEYRFNGVGADFRGFEAQVALHLLGDAGQDEDLAFVVQPDYVWAQDRTSGSALPRIPPFRLKGRLQYLRESLNGGVELQHVFSQERVAEFETETGGYDLLNIDCSYGLTISGLKVTAYLRGQNLLNQEARNHVSFIKDVAPLPGRNLMGGLQVAF